MTKQLPIENEIKKRKWRWIGHTLRKPPNTITRQAITWNPPGKRRRGRPRTRNTWQRDTGKETKEMGFTRREMEKMATDRKRWRSFVDGLYSQRANRHKLVSNHIISSFTEPFYFSKSTYESVLITKWNI